MIDFGTRILGWENPVTAVTIRAACGSAVSIRHCAPVNTLPVQLHRVCERNVVPRQKLLVAVTGGARVRQILLGYQRGRVARALDLVDRSVAGDAIGCVRVAGCGRFSVDTLLEFFYLIGVALRALCRESAAPQS